MNNRSWPLRAILLTIALSGPAHPATAQNTPDACGADTLCIADGRFEITVEWESSTGSGSGHPVVLTESTGYFWFFDPVNVEMVVKIVDACADYGREWVFAGGLTDVGVTMKVKNTQSGFYKTYTNPKGTPFLPIQDTSTLVGGCPPPQPAGPLTGAWAGTFNSVGDHFFYDCDSNVQAHATFTQQGPIVDGKLSSDERGCRFSGATFHGTLDGDILSGTIQGSTAIGSLSGTILTLTLANHNRYHPSPIPGGTMRLFR